MAKTNGTSNLSGMNNANPLGLVSGSSNSGAGQRQGTLYLYTVFCNSLIRFDLSLLITLLN